MPESIVERTLPGSGIVVRLQMPDLYSMLTAGDIPNPLIAPILMFLEGVKPREADYMANLIGARDNIRALYHIAHLCLVSPRLVLTGQPEEGEIGVRDLRWDDLTSIYIDFFRGEPLSTLTAFTDFDQPPVAVGSPSPSDDLRDEAESDPRD